MSALYQLAVLGAHSADQISELENVIAQLVQLFGLRLGHEVEWDLIPAEFTPHQQKSSAAVFYAAPNAPLSNLAQLLNRGVPILPAVSEIERVTSEIPELLRPFNCLAYNTAGTQRIATALLECAGLLPRQRRVFVSYRRNEAREAALQLFDAFSADSSNSLRSCGSA